MEHLKLIRVRNGPIRGKEQGSQSSRENRMRHFNESVSLTSTLVIFYLPASNCVQQKKSVDGQVGETAL